MWYINTKLTNYSTKTTFSKCTFDYICDMKDESREIWVDWMRVAACFMVMIVHSTEPFYLGGEGALILTRADAFWASLSDSLARSCVPLFIIASSYLQFPLHYSAGEFLRRRAVRILVPFAFWTVVYALVWGEPVQNFHDLLLNFNYAAGHLWFVYMLVGVYVLMPLLSPWAAKVGRKELQVYLGIWAFTLFIPFVREAASGGVPVVHGPSGIPMQGTYPLWGEASWNSYGAFYYISGFMGYMLLGLWFRKFAGEYSWKRTLAGAVPVWLAGFAVCFGGFLRRVFESSGGVFPTGGAVDVATVWETPWYNDTIGVAMMAVGWILVFRKIGSDGWFYRNILLPVSKASYGMYLCHMLALGAYASLFRGTLGTGTEGALGVWTTPLEIVLTAVCSFITVAVFATLVRRIPKAGKLLIG